MPQLQECIEQLKSNKEAWSTYVETEQDQKVYEIKKNAEFTEEESKLIDGSQIWDYYE